MSDKIGLELARNLLAQAVDTQGRDFVYNKDGMSGVCANVPIPNHGSDDNDPRRKTGCIVGTAMALSGVVPNMQEHEFGPVSFAFHRYLTAEAETYFAVAQIKQDNGSTWGEAFDAAEEYLNTGLAPEGMS